MNARVHPLFASILGGIEQQPLALHRAAAKAGARRFTAAPVTAFADLAPAHTVRFSDAWFERQAEIMADELASQREDERDERMEQGE